MSSFANFITTGICERLFRNVIDRFVGDFLLDSSLNKLSANVVDGELSLHEVQLNVQSVNEWISSLCLPFILLDGFLGNLRIKMPWLSLTTHPIQISLSEVELTFQDAEIGNASYDLSDFSTEHFFSSGKLAQSFFEEGQREGFGKENLSVSAFEQLVKTLLSRFSISLEDVIIRIETKCPDEPQLFTAVELRVKRCSVDDQLTWLNRQDENISSYEAGTIVSVLHGISLYTDIFCQSSLSCSSLGIPMSSLSARRLSHKNSPLHSSMNSENSTEETSIFSDPIQVVELNGETTVVMAYPKDGHKFDVQMRCGGPLRMLLSSSQIVLLYDMISRFIHPSDSLPSEIAIEERSVVHDNLGHFDKFDEIPLSDFIDGIPSRSITEKVISLCCNLAGSPLVKVHVEVKDVILAVFMEDPFSQDVKGWQTKIQRMKTVESCFFSNEDDELESLLFDHLRFRVTLLSVNAMIDSYLFCQIELFASLFTVDEHLTGRSTMDGVPQFSRLFEYRQKGNAERISIKADTLRRNLKILLCECESEMDVSILDRLHNIFFPRPFFRKVTTANESLATNLSSFFHHTIISTGKMSVRLRFPQSNTGGCDRSVRSLHKDYVKLDVELLSISILSEKGEEVDMTITADKAIGSYVNEESKEVNFFVASSSVRGERIIVNVERDKSQRSLEREYNKNEYEEMDGDEDPIVEQLIKTISHKRKGPFTSTSSTFTRKYATKGREEETIRAGSRAELDKFGKECFLQSSFSAKVTTDLLKVNLQETEMLRRVKERMNSLLGWRPQYSMYNDVSICVEGDYPSPSFSHSNPSIFVREENQEQSHILSLSVKSKDAIIVHPLVSSNVIVNLNHLCTFLCFGVHGDPLHTIFYLYTDSISVHLTHKYEMDVVSSHFGDIQGMDELVYSCCEEWMREECLTVAVEGRGDWNELQEVTWAVNMRQLTVNVVNGLGRMDDIVSMMTGMQEGEWKTLGLSSLNIHMEKIRFVYDHSKIAIENRLTYNLDVDEVECSVRMDENGTNFFFLSDDIKLTVMRNKTHMNEPVSILLARNEMLHIELLQSMDLSEQEYPSHRHIHSLVGNTTFWLCSDSLAELLVTIKELMKEVLVENTNTGTNVDGKLESIDDANTGEYRIVQDDSPYDKSFISLLFLNAQFSSIEIRLFGGNDLGNFYSSVKDLSLKEEKRRRNGRDYSVCVAIEAKKCFISHRLFSSSSITSLLHVSLSSFVIRDELTKSNINEMIYLDSTRLHSPIGCSHLRVDCNAMSFVLPPFKKHPSMFSLRCTEDNRQRKRVMISMSPLRCNLDEDTMDFIVRFMEEIKVGIHDDDFELLVMDEGDDTVEEEGESSNKRSLFTFHSSFPQGTRQCSIPPRTCHNDDGEESETIDGSYIDAFTFFPPSHISIDYNGKARAMMNGDFSFAGFVKAMSRLSDVEIELCEVNNRRGLTNANDCLSFCLERWLGYNSDRGVDILSKIGPMKPFLSLGKGIVDVVWKPLSEWRNNGDIRRGLRDGGGSFGRKTALTAVELAQNAMGAVQGVTEYAMIKASGEKRMNSSSIRPKNLRHGAQLALDTIINGVGESSHPQTCSSLWTVARLIRPLAISAQAGGQLLTGIKNQMIPGKYEDDRHKYKQ